MTRVADYRIEERYRDEDAFPQEAGGFPVGHVSRKRALTTFDSLVADDAAGDQAYGPHGGLRLVLVQRGDWIWEYHPDNGTDMDVQRYDPLAEAVSARG